MIPILLEYLSQSKVMWKLRIIIKFRIKRESWVHKDNVSEEDVVCPSPGGLSILISLPRRPMPSDDDCKVDGTLKPFCRQASDSGPFSGQTNVRSVCRWLVCRASWTAERADAGCWAELFQTVEPQWMILARMIFCFYWLFSSVTTARPAAKSQKK